MLRFIVRRLLLLVPILFGLSILVFVWIRVLPGSPGAGAPRRAGDAAARRARSVTSTGSTSRSTCSTGATSSRPSHLDFGTSIITTSDRHRRARASLPGHGRARARGDDLRRRASGSRSASWPRSGTALRSTTSSLLASLIGISIPIFFLGLILKYIFSVRLGWLPSIGREDVLANRSHPTNFYILDAIIDGDPEAFWDTIKHLILPAIALGSIPLAIIARITRASVLDVQNEDYVRTARAKGLPPRHRRLASRAPERAAADLDDRRPADGPAALGRGADRDRVRLAGRRQLARATAIFNRDYPVLQGGILFLAVVFVVVNLVVDISYAIINPRIRVS